MKLLDLLQMEDVLILNEYGDLISWSHTMEGVYIFYPESDEPRMHIYADTSVTLTQVDNELTFSLINTDDTESWFTPYLYKPLTFEHLLQISLGIPASEL